MIVAVLLSALVLIGWTYVSEIYFPAPKPVTPAVTAAAAPTAGAPAATAADASAPVVAGGAVPAAAATATIADRGRVLAASPRVAIDTPRLKGSINLKGARFDDLVLPTYRVTIAKDSPPIRLLSPSGTADAYFGQFGWTGAGAPPADALWTASAPTLTTAAPVTLSWTSPAGLVFEQVISVDKDFLFTIRQRVRNPTAAAVAVQPWGLVSRRGQGSETTAYNLHVGPIGVMDGTLRDSEVDYSTLKDDGPKRYTTTGGWLGITDKYWLAAVIPDQKARVETRFAAAPGDQFQTDYLAAGTSVAPGATVETTARFFAGAKEVALLDGYMKTLGIPHFDLAVSWGWFIIIAQPIFWLLDYFGALIGNFGLAILCVTVVVKALLFPLVNRSYEAMSKLKIIQPKMKEVQERFAKDPQRQQQEMIKLYQAEKVDPVAGCLPILAQIPIFYALYKTLTVTIEMRHAPFFGWITDLSAKDPTAWVNLFGLLPFDAQIVTGIPIIGGLFAIGVWPLLYGLTMWGVQSLSPPAPDPIQRQIFALMPVMFVFLFANFAAGLVIYWTWSNLLSILQQYAIMRRNGVDTEFDKLWRKVRGQPDPA